jgi:hypothetical protein
MAFVDASTSRKVLEGVCPVKITLAGAVSAGDPIKYSSGWKLATNESGKPAILIAGEDGVVGDEITAYGMAVIEFTHTAANVPTMGEQIAVDDTGIYAPDGAGLQDIGYIVNIDADNKHSRGLVCGMIVELDLAGT